MIYTNNSDQFFLFVDGVVTFGKNKQWSFQLYYPHGSLRIGRTSKYGKDFHVNIAALTFRVNSDASGAACGFKLLGFGCGVQRLSDAEYAEQRRLHAEFDKFEKQHNAN